MQRGHLSNDHQDHSNQLKSNQKLRNEQEHPF